jgi:DNA-binding beta-propeller fold protein YncE
VVLAKLSAARVEVTAIDAVCVDGGRYGAILSLVPAAFDRAFDVLGISRFHEALRGPRIPRFRVIEAWGKLPDGWRYVEAAGVAVDSKDNVYVFNRGEHPLIGFDRDGNFLRSWGEGLMKRPHGITMGPDDDVWLTDDGNHTIRKFTVDGKLLLTIGEPDRPAPLESGRPFNRPTHVALSPTTGDLFISDGYGNSRVHKYDPKGRHLVSWGEPGTDPGCFNIPHNIATDVEGQMYVADRENHRIQIFDAGGRYLDQINNLHRPWALFVDGRRGGQIYVGEAGTDLSVNQQVANLGGRVSILTPDGELLARIGSPFRGEKPGEFIAPHGVVTDSRGDLYVAEVSFTAKGRHEAPPREIRCFQKFVRIDS